MYTLTAEPRLMPVTIKPAQARSICRILNKAGIPCDIETDPDGNPLFTGATGGQVAAAAHLIPSMAGLPWLKVLLKGTETAAPSFSSNLLRWAE